MSKVNYRLLMEREIAQFTKNGCQPTLLLHVCCAPCASGMLEMLCRHFRVTCFYYNPNISPREECEKREGELQRLVREIPLENPPRVLVGEYEPEAFYAAAHGLENVPEGGERCFACYRLRLEKTARMAAEEGFDYFTTSLSVSPLKNADKLNEIGAELAEKSGVKYLFSDFKKGNGYLTSIQNSRKYGLYRQDYCGCIYSKLQREREKADENKGV